jgi:hypothetical protein
VTRRGFLAGALGLAAASAIARTAVAASPADDPSGGLLADPAGGQRFSLRLSGKEVGSFQSLRQRRPEGSETGDLEGKLKDIMGAIVGVEEVDDADDDTAGPRIMLLNGTGVVPFLQDWYEGGQLTGKQGRQKSAHDVVIARVSPAGKVLGRLTLEGATASRLVLNSDESSIERLVLTGESVSVARA